MTNEEIYKSLPWGRWNSQPWLRERTIFLTKHGSHCYGLNRPTSDIDVKGIAIPPKEYFFGILNKFDEANTSNNKEKQPGELDCVIYDIRKFCGLAAECNPNVIEVLFTDLSDWVTTSPAHQRLVENRNLFLSTQARFRFSGYAHQQLKRIEGHYRWLKNPPKAPPTRAEFGLPEHGSHIPKNERDAIESVIRKQVEAWDIDWEPLGESLKIGLKAKLTESLTEMKLATEDERWAAAAKRIGLSDNLIEILKQERLFQTRLAEWKQYLNWKANRNPDRAVLEEKFGFDTKHACHLVRLLRMAREILRDGKVVVKRPDRDELLAIRDGAWSYEKLIEWAKVQDAEMEVLYKSSPLPREPKRKEIDKLCMSIVEESLR